MALLAAVGGWRAPAASAALAGLAACPESVEDRYEPGDTVTVVGYTRGCVPDVGDRAVDTRPLLGHLHPDPHPCTTSVPCIPFGDSWFGDPAAGTRVGTFAVEQGRHPPRGLRMFMTFTLPADLAPGAYFVTACQAPCPDHLNYGDSRPLFVGVDPPAGWSSVHNWPLDDPAIAQLPDTAVLLGPAGNEVTTAEVRAGEVTAATSTTGPGDGGGRVETAAAPTDQDDESRGNNTLLLVALGGGLALLLVVWRRGAGHKQVRRPPATRP